MGVALFVMLLYCSVARYRRLEMRDKVCDARLSLSGKCDLGGPWGRLLLVLLAAVVLLLLAVVMIGSVDHPCNSHRPSNSTF